MQLIIHRGTHEIGGSCLELVSNSGNSRLVVDLGLPLVNPDLSQFEWRKYREHSIPKLLDEKILPNIKGLYGHPASVRAVLLSHAHIDHYGLLRFVNTSIPIYMSLGTKILAEVSNIFLDTAVNIASVQIFDMWKTFEIGEFQVKPFLMDHSAPDAVAFLIKCDGKQVFYTGDFRGHGRKSVVFDRIISEPLPDIDYLIMEGSTFGRLDGLYPDEETVKDHIFNELSNRTGPGYIFASSQNLDRLISIYKASRKAHKTIVLDLYTAFVLDKLSEMPGTIPQFNWSGIKVMYAYRHAQKLAEVDVNLLYKYRISKIERDEILKDPGDKVLLAKDNRYFRNSVIRKLNEKSPGFAIFSMWHGYLVKNDLEAFLNNLNIPLIEIHCSGHAYMDQLEKLANALKPKYIIPIHTFYPERYVDMFGNTLCLEDGKPVTL